MDRDYMKAREILDDIIQRAGGVDNQTGLNAAILKLDTWQAEGKQGDALADALRTSESLRTVAPQFHQHFLLRAALLYAMNEKPDDALAIYRNLLSHDVASPQSHLEALVQTAMLFDTAEESGKAIDVLGAYLERNPSSPLEPTVCVYLARLLARQKKEEESRSFFDRAVSAVQKQIETAEGADTKSLLYFQLAQIHDAAGAPEEGRKVYRHVIDAYPMGRHRPAAMMLLAQSLHSAGESDLAIQELARVMQLYPNTPQAVQAYRRFQEIRAAKDQASRTTDTLQAAPAADAGTTVSQAQR
jgi:TolA-binding protein